MKGPLSYSRSEARGCPPLVYSPIQLRMANQSRIFPIGRLDNVEVDLGINHHIVI